MRGGNGRRHLRFDRMDRTLLLLFVGLAVVTTLAGFTTATSELWTPQFLIDLAMR